MAAKRWIDLANQGRRALDPGPMLSMSASDCRTCKGKAFTTNRVREDGGHYAGDFEVHVVDAHYVDLPDQPTVSMIVEHGDFRIVKKAGAEPVQVEADRYSLQIAMKKEGQTWLVANSTIVGE